MAVSKDEWGGCTIQLDEEEEGNSEATVDYIFQRIGEPVPIKLQNTNFDTESPPIRPLAVSEQFGAIFVAHNEGFYVAKTKDVIEAAKEIKEIDRGSCIQDLSVVDVPIGKAYILALSMDSSTLAVTVDGVVHFFLVESLLNKEKEPYFSDSLADSTNVKDFQWRKNSENSYLVLSDQGMLYHGFVKGPFKDVMDNVDAVDWSVKGKYVAVARNSNLSILSSKFVEQFCMSLSFKSWNSDPDPKCRIKVDSLKWVRSDSIVVGCFQLTENSGEEGYLVQVISSREGKITDTSSKHFVLCFSDLFSGIVDDIFPFGGGPYLFSSYLEPWELAFVANRKNTDEHIVLLGWSLDEQHKEAAVISLNRDKWLPRIELQENGDDNLIMGIGVDKVSLYDKVKVELENEVQKELSPYCVLLCLTLEGKLTMFHFASVAEPPVPPRPVFSLSDEEEDSSASIHLGSDTSKTSRIEENKGEETSIELNTKGGVNIPKEIDLKPPELNVTLKSSFVTEQISHKKTSTQSHAVENFGNSMTSEIYNKHTDPTKHSQDAEQSQLSGQKGSNSGQSSLNIPSPQGFSSAFSRTETQKVDLSSEGKITSDSSNTNLSNKNALNHVELGKSSLEKVGSTSFQNAASGSWSSGGLLLSNDLNARYSPAASSSIPGKVHENAGPSTVNSTPGKVHQNSSDLLSGDKVLGSKDYSASPFSNAPFSGRATENGGQRTTIGAGNAESVPPLHTSQISLPEGSVLGRPLSSKLHHTKEINRITPSSAVLDSDPEFSKHFGNVKEMAKELDTLLSYIEKEGGFRDACTVFQRSSVLALEQEMENLSDRCRVWRNTIEVCLEEVKNLLSKTVQVLARKIHMEGIVKQASDSQYWDLWDRQKLSPELELKRRQILKLNQDLTNRMVELERHFNTLELNKFGENGGVPMGRRAVHGCLEVSGQIPSLHSLYNTMNSQLSAAQQLSECLTKQMAVLNIESPSAKRQNVAKELFESIGLEYDGDSFDSPNVKRAIYPPDPVKKLPYSLCGTAVKQQSRRIPSNAKRSYEPETVRRRRDSLDRSWANSEPPKTTVKRVLLREEQARVTADKSSLLMTKECRSSQRQEGFSDASLKGQASSPPSLYISMNKAESPKFLEKKDVLDKPLKQNFESESTFFKWAGDRSQLLHTAGLKSPVTQVTPRSNLQSFSLSVASESSPNSVQNNRRETGDLAIDRSNTGLCPIGKNDSSAFQSNPISWIKANTQFEAPRNQTPSTRLNLTHQTLVAPKKTPDVKTQRTDLSHTTVEGAAQTKPTGSAKHEAVTPERYSAVPEKIRSSSFPTVSTNEPAAALHGKLSHFDAVTTKIQPVTASASAVPPAISTSPSGSFPSPTISLSISLSKSANASPISLASVPSSSSAMSYGGLLTSKPSTEADKMIPLPMQSSDPSGLAPFSSAPFQTPKLQALPSIQSASTNSTSQAPFTEIKPSVGDFDPKSDASAIFQAPVSHPMPATDESTSKPEPPVPLEPAAGEASTRLASGSQPNFNNVFSAGSSVASSSQSEPPSAATASFPTSLLSSSNAPDGKKESLEITQEDEMEEEAPDMTTDVSLGNLDGLGIGSNPLPAAPKPNPFDGPFNNVASNPTSPFTLTAPSGELFRPASFSFQSPFTSQQSQPTTMATFSGGFITGSTPSPSTGSGFGQPSHIGPGQQALGSVLGAFGQSRQLGSSLPGNAFASASGFGGGGFSAAAKTGIGFGSGSGFSGTSTAGGFAGVASTSGGFGGVASTVGGFHGVASSVGGFANAATSSGGGFAGGGSGSGFAAAGAAGGGFGAFANKQGGGAFPTLGGSVGGSGGPPSELFTQMRK
ncbi:nuclear pore complex protein NUP214 isoform X2 [Macadamia integrifolia]|uniref:nuclear pore complex protein NUP214 isoform X2 n=1 Tax=Macadamia integrifolia TaxID=60698 RepID=UPI001C52867D|nr:nuclear pore complex protein NUP214 isoform X2 [Macadamia integrifolia]